MNWGIIGYGEIAPSFIIGLSTVEGQNLYAIASKSKHEILNRNNTHPGVKIYSSYDLLINDSNVEIVYVCTTNNLHKDNVLEALRAGKHVLCEKPLGVCKEDVKEMVEEAERQGKFLLEGMWTRFLPSYRYFKYLLKSNRIGAINFVQVDFGFSSLWSSDKRLGSKALFGGAILDNCDYAIFLTQDIFGVTPTKISAFSRYMETGVEDQCGIMLQYPNGSIAQLFCGFHQKTNQDAVLYGERGSIRLQRFWSGTHVELNIEGEIQAWEFPFKNNGFEYEIEETVSCIRNGDLQSSVMTHQMSLEVAEIMDLIIKNTKEAV